jgi:hypothetical protein
MNLTKKTILALGALVAAGVSYGQNATSETTPVGVLGQSYAEAHFGTSDIKHYSKDQYDLGAAVNHPVTPYLDLTGGYDYGWVSGTGHFNGVSAGATAYKSYKGVKPFVGAGLGYQWTRWGNGKDDLFVWGLTAGVEIPVDVVTITPRIVFSDDFRRPARSSQQTSYEVEANYWVSKTLAIFASVGYSDVNHTSNDSWDYDVGARFKF